MKAVETYPKFAVTNGDSEGRSLDKQENGQQSGDRNHCEKNVVLSECGVMVVVVVVVVVKRKRATRYLDVLEGMGI